MKRFLLFLFIISPFLIYSQIFNSLEEALKKPNIVEHLVLRGKKIKIFPNEILTLTNLKFLDLSKNKLITLPDSIHKLENLEVLILNKNNINVLPSSIGEIYSLNKIDLWRNNIDELPKKIQELKNLRELDLRGILISKEKQKAIIRLLPYTKIYFDKPCKCD